MSDPTRLRMPNLGAEATGGTVAAWLRAVGDVVAAGDVVAEIETEKATVEIEAPVAGRITEIMQPVGAEVAVGETLALIEPG
ncbi:MAG TPA: lipoyl domain-containing protein [Candidatus Limnocylindrales bacterium]|nr:lipoyl domain-containing protein [Candidatus Limnocylindrales bacterium]